MTPIWNRRRNWPGYALTLAALVAMLFVAACDRVEEPQEPDLLDLARDAYAIGQFTDAERYYQDYLESTEEGVGRWEAWSRLVDISLSVHGDFDIGAERLEIMILEFGQDSTRRWDLLVRLAEVYEAMHEWGKATDAWQQVLNLPDLEPEQIPRIHWQLAKIHQYSGDYDLALDALDRCLDSSQTPSVQAECLFDKSQTLVYMKRTYEARQLLNQILEMEGVPIERHAFAAFMLADLMEQINEYQLAEELLMSIRDTYPHPMVVETRLKHLREVMESR